MKYATGHVVGRGGMGVVYRSWDPRLERPVALKVLHRDGAESAERMLREAKAQAGIAHPNVCPVYEVGLLDERPYIAMQWIDGVPLDEAVSGLPLERKVHLFATVVDAVQAAHAAGLVHRDLKPANVLVETGADGELKPYVLDFGIARLGSGETALTRTGQVIGTPGYVSPEQARGDRDLDRRSDVFSLGCVLYEVLSGEPPFQGAGVEALYRVLDQDPKPLRQANPAVPADLATITEKCLEKERDRRYGSARELAADLHRFLAGDPIRARPASAIYRWSKRARRHPVATGAVAVAVAAALTMAGVAAHSRATANEQAAVAQRFGREVERIDSGMRLAHLSALHDVRPRKRELRERLRRLEAELPRLGAVALGPGSFALGSGYLSLGDARRAEEHLERAWTAGYRQPEVAHALARALGTLYREGLSDAERLDDEAARVGRQRALALRYRDRALALLREAGAAEGLPARLLEAQVALYEGRFDRAAELAAREVAAAPWLYEAHLLRGDALAAAAAASRGDGDVEAQLGRLAEADAAYARAAREARSDPTVHDRRCSLGVQAVTALFFGPGGDLSSRVDAAAEACRRSLVADSDRGRPHALLAGLYLQQSRDLSRRGEDPMAAMARAVDEARQAVRLEPEVAEHQRSLGNALAFRGEFERERGIDSASTLHEAVRHLERAIALEPRDGAGHNGLGLAHWELVLRARAFGEDQRPHLDAAEAAFLRATGLVPKYARAFSNLGSIYNLRIEYETARGLDASASMEAAAAAFGRAIEADPGYVYAYNNLGNVFRHRGELALESGRDPTADLERAERHFREAAERNPQWSYPHFNAGLALHDLARWRRDVGGDVDAALDRAAEDFRRGLAIKPDLPQALLSAALVEVLRARHELDRSRNPAAALAAARLLVNRALELDPGSGFGHEVRGEVELLAARSAGPGGGGHLQRAEAALERALEAVPDSATAHQLLAELSWHRAVWERTRGRSPEAALAQGLAAAGRALEINPRAAGAEAIRGELHLLRAEAAGQAAGAAAEAGAAERALRHALELKPTLARRHGASVTRARALATRG